MRLMRKGDKAFLYHSNTKVPGIAGLMEIAQEHSVDRTDPFSSLFRTTKNLAESAFDPSHPYYDQKSDRNKPKWDVVHVQFVRKFNELIKLSLLKSFAQKGGVLENMQTFRQSRLSVSKVTPKEWNFIMSLVDEEDDDQGVESEAPGNAQAAVDDQMEGGEAQDVANGVAESGPSEPNGKS